MLSFARQCCYCRAKIKVNPEWTFSLFYDMHSAFFYGTHKKNNKWDLLISQWWFRNASNPGPSRDPESHIFFTSHWIWVTWVEYTYTESQPTAWFIPTDCPQLLQLPEPVLGMHSWMSQWGKSTDIHVRGLIGFPSSMTEREIETCRYSKCCKCSLF